MKKFSLDEAIAFTRDNLEHYEDYQKHPGLLDKDEIQGMIDSTKFRLELLLKWKDDEDTIIFTINDDDNNST